MKTIEEWSNAFDVFLGEYVRNNPSLSNSLLSFDEYEKSVFLTEAQKEVIKEVYNSNYTGSAFEKTESDRRKLDALVSEFSYGTPEKEGLLIQDGFNHYIYKLPSNCWYIVFEQIRIKNDSPCLSNKTLSVIPITHDSYNKAINNPFKSPNTRKAWRMDIGNFEVDIISKFIIDTYIMRYIAKPSPIILVDLSEDLSIDGYTKTNTCEVSEILHKDILDMAIKLAVASRISYTNSK